MKSVKVNCVVEIDFFTVCFTPRSFGAGTSRAVQKRTQNHPERAIIRKPGEKSGLRDIFKMIKELLNVRESSNRAH